MRLKLNLNLFSKELVLFSLALALAIFIAYSYGQPGRAPVQVEKVQFDWLTLATMVGFFFFFTFILTRMKKVSGSLFRIFLMLVVFGGAELTAGTFIGAPYDTLIGLGFLLLVVGFRNVFTHNLGIIVGIAGVAGLLGVSLQPMSVVFILVGLSFYDIIAVYRTKHMVALARGMMDSGAIFGFLVPASWRDFFSPKPGADLGGRFMMLGSGDIGLPAVLSASIAPTDITGAIIIGIFSIIGLFGTHLLFTNQSERRPMAALPPIAATAIIGYLVYNLIVLI